MKRLIFIGSLLWLVVTAAVAQETEKALLDKLNTIEVSTTPTPGAPSSPDGLLFPETTSTSAKPKATGTNGPTIITCTKEATFDEKTHTAVFIEDVHVDDPQFALTCDKLTAYLKSTAETAPGAGAKTTGTAGGKGAGAAGVKAAAGPKTAGSASPSVTPAAKPGGSLVKSGTAAAKSGGGGLDKADAEGHVIINQDKPDPKGGKPTHYVGKSQKAHYDAATGDVTLTGWPQVQEGVDENVNTHISTDESTVMIMSQGGGMHTKGPSRTEIVDKSSLQGGSPSPSPGGSPGESASPTPKTP